jgi:hypothetical protein
MSKPRVDPTFGISSVDVVILTERHPHVDGAKLNQALVRNVRTWPAMPREKAQAAPTARPKVPMTVTRDLAFAAFAQVPEMSSSIGITQCG